VEQLLAKFSPTEIAANATALSPGHRRTLEKLVEASLIIDDIFLDQVDAENREVRARLTGPTRDLFDVMYGPWNRLEEEEPFYGDRRKPAGAGFYPPDLTKEVLEEWIAAHPETEEQFRGFFHLVRRQGDELVAVPYSVAYGDRLKRAAALLREGAAAAEHPALKKYLELRAEAFGTNEYRDSDMAWMDLGDSPIEVVIGPYEVYEDKLMGYKAAFEAFVTLRDPVYSDKLASIGERIGDLEKKLPIDPKHLTKRGLDSPISVVDVVFTAGDTRAGVQTAAFNLPNDEYVREKKGSKKVLLKNVIEAKFNKVLVPIAQRLLAPELLPRVQFDPYFTEILIHELAHGMGPGKIVVDGRATEVSRELKELYPAIEECKADILGLVNGFELVDMGLLPQEMTAQLPATYVAGVFRAVRFGVEEAHGKAMLTSFNYLREKGAVVRDPASGRYSVNYDRFRAQARELARELMMVQARGSYAEAKAMLEKYGEPDEELRADLAKLDGIPVDIRPQYTVLEQMKS
jgi:hypothetical protein